MTNETAKKNDKVASKPTAKTADKPASKPAKKPKSGAGWWVTAVLFLVIAGAGVASYYYLWPQWLAFNASKSETATTQPTPAAATVAQAAALERQIAALQQQFQQREQSSQAEIKRLNDGLNRYYQELRDTQQLVAATQTELSLLAPSSQTAWRILETQQLTERATVKLWVENDPSAAAQLLQLAHEQLEYLNNPAHLTTRQALRNDIQTLQALPAATGSDAGLTLVSLRELVMGIDWYDRRNSQLAEPVNRPVADNWLGNIKRSALALTDQFIRIQQHDKPIQPLLADTYVELTEQRLLLQLQLAQQAALQGDQEVFVATLTEAQTLLASVQQLPDPQLQQLASQLQLLQQLQLQPDYPAQLQSPALVKRLADSLQGGQS